MIELRASTRIRREEQVRYAIRDRESDFRRRFLEELARGIAEQIINTRGAVEITEDMDPSTGDLVMTARCYVADSRSSAQANRFEAEEYRRAELMRQKMQEIEEREAVVRRAQYQAKMEAALYMMPSFMIDGPFKPFSGMDKDSLRGLSEETLNKAQAAMLKNSPIDFLQDRATMTKAKVKATLDAMEKMKNEATIKRSTRKRGKDAPLIEIGVRKIKMPEEAKG